MPPPTAYLPFRDNPIEFASAMPRPLKHIAICRFGFFDEADGLGQNSAFAAAALVAARKGIAR